MSTTSSSSDVGGIPREPWSNVPNRSQAHVEPDAHGTGGAGHLCHGSALSDRVRRPTWWPIDQLTRHGRIRGRRAAWRCSCAATTPRLGFDFFDFLTAVDEREDGFAVVIHLYSTNGTVTTCRSARWPTEAVRGLPCRRSATCTRGANWHERETYDMFGITFEGHPGLLPRILTVENFEGFPLRKEFLLMSREVKPWPGLKEPDGGRGRRRRR